MHTHTYSILSIIEGKIKEPKYDSYSSQTHNLIEKTNKYETWRVEVIELQITLRDQGLSF